MLVRTYVRIVDPDGVAALVGEIIPLNSCLVFCPTKKYCENVASMLGNAFKQTKAEDDILKRRMKLLSGTITVMFTLVFSLTKVVPEQFTTT